MTKNQKITIGLISGFVLVGFGYFLFGRNKYSPKGKLRNPKPKSILFIGDSLTAIKNYANNSRIPFTYPNFVEENLKSKGITVDVLAKGGEETKWMLKNLPDKLKEKKFDRIYIQGGGNDGINLVPFEKFKSNVNQMIDLGHKSGADVYYIVGFDQEKTLDPNKVGTTRYVPNKEDMYKRFKIYFDWQKN